MAKKDERNRAIFAAYMQGISKVSLAARHGLSVASVASILTAERHKQSVSPDPEYRKLRLLNPTFKIFGFKK